MQAVNEEELKTFFNNILGYAFTDDGEGNIVFTKITSDILEMNQSIKDQAEAFDISYEKVQDYAKILRENNEVLKDQIELSEKIALAEKKQAKGADDLIDNYKDYVNILKKAKLDSRIKSTIEYSEAITNLRKDLSLLTGYEEDIFTDDFINSDEIQQALLDISISLSVTVWFALSYVRGRSPSPNPSRRTTSPQSPKSLIFCGVVWRINVHPFSAKTNELCVPTS